MTSQHSAIDRAAIERWEDEGGRVLGPDELTMFAALSVRLMSSPAQPERARSNAEVRS